VGSRRQSAVSTASGILGRIAGLVEQQDFSTALAEIQKLEEDHRAEMSMVEIGRLHLCAADAFFYLGQYAEALNAASLAIEGLRHTNAHDLYGRAKWRRGHVLISLGKCPDAADDFREARFAFKRINNPEGELDSCNLLARCAFVEGDYLKAKEYLQRAIELAEQSDDRVRCSFMRPNLGRVLALLGEFTEAKSYLSLDSAFAKLENPANKCNRVSFLGYLLILMREFEDAEVPLEESRKIAHENSFSRELSIHHEYAGELAFWQGNKTKAESHYRKAIEIGMEIAPEGDIISQSYRLLAELQVDRGELEAAEESCDRAWQVAEKISERLELGAIQRTRGEIAARRGDAETAKTAFEESIRILGEISAKYELARAHLLAGEAGIFDNQYRLTNLFAARTLFDQVGVAFWQDRVSARIDEMIRQASLPAEPVASGPGGHPNGGVPFIAVSSAMREILQKVEKVKNTDMTLLILGETGVGKDLLARYVHCAGDRANRPFESICTAAIPEHLWESELFGHVKGSFTGVDTDRPGRLERADGGTVYLNEISEIPLRVQAKFLEFIEWKETQRLGGREKTKLDIRFIAASNRDLRKEMEAGRFRADLYYRLNQMPIVIPPLRERGGDIRELTRHFLKQYNYPTDKIRHLLNSPFCQLLDIAGWPGNVRQLKHVIQRLVVLADGADPGEMIKIAHEIMAAEGLLANDQREKLISYLAANGWNKRKTAQGLGISERTLGRKIKSFNIIDPSKV